MLLQQEQKKEQLSHILCSGNGKNQTTTRGANRPSHADDSKEVVELSPFGFPDTVRAYVREHENKSSSKGLYCLAPPSEPSCQTSQYTVLIYSGGNHDDARRDSAFFNNLYWRNIVVTVMKFLAYPSVERVNLVLREQETQSTIEAFSSANSTDSSRPKMALEAPAKRNKYAKRILNWSRKGVVNVVSVSSLWEAIDRLEVPSESVLWIDADYLHGSHRNGNNIANGTVLEHRFRKWRDAPNALTIPQESHIVPVSLSQINNHDDDKDNTLQSVCKFPLLHEMMMHTNYLCFFNHPVVGSELRNYTKFVRRRIKSSDNDEKQLSWEMTTIAMGMLIFSIGDGYVIEDADHSSDGTAAYHPLFGAPGNKRSLVTYTEGISNYFGCPCSMMTPRLFPSNTPKCSSG